MTQQHDAPEGGAKLKQFALERLDGQPMLRFGALDGFVFEDPVDEGILANLKVWLNHMLESDRGFVDRMPGVRTLVAYPAEHEREPDASAMFRALAHHDGVPEAHRPSDNEPLRNCLPGIWPTVGDLRAALAPIPPAPVGLVDAVRDFLGAQDAWDVFHVTYDDGNVYRRHAAEWNRLGETLSAARATLDATLSGQQGGAVPDEFDIRNGYRVGPGGEVIPLDEHGRDIPKVQQGGAVPAGDDDEGVTLNDALADDRKHRARLAEQPATAGTGTFTLGDRVEKIKGSSWRGPIVGFYWASLTPIGYAVESEREPGSVQIYPEAALRAAPAGTGDADRVEGLRPGLKKALEIVEAKRQTVPTASSAHDTCVSLMGLFRARLAATPDLNERADG